MQSDFGDATIGTHSISLYDAEKFVSHEAFAGNMNQALHGLQALEIYLLSRWHLWVILRNWLCTPMTTTCTCILSLHLMLTIHCASLASIQTLKPVVQEFVFVESVKLRFRFFFFFCLLFLMQVLILSSWNANQNFMLPTNNLCNNFVASAWKMKWWRFRSPGCLISLLHVVQQFSNFCFLFLKTWAQCHRAA